MVAGWLVGRMAGWLAVWVAGCWLVARWLAGWMLAGCSLAGWMLAGWMVGKEIRRRQPRADSKCILIKFYLKMKGNPSEAAQTEPPQSRF